ncbi:hypothetical protein SERLA73DRAFT_182979, partial [Serpula lacrymans var. lacrymans S7.3]
SVVTCRIFRPSLAWRMNISNAAALQRRYLGLELVGEAEPPGETTIKKIEMADSDITAEPTTAH